MTHNERKNIKVGIYIGYITFIINIVSHLLFTPYYLKTVGDAQYGIYSFALSLTSWLTLLVTSMGISYLREAAKQYRENELDGEYSINTFFFIVFGIFAAAAFLFLVVLLILLYSGVISLNNYSSNEKVVFFTVFSLSGLSVVLTMLFNVFTLFENYKKRFIFSRSVALLPVIFNPIISYILISRGYGVSEVVLVSFVMTIVTILITIFHATKVAGFKTKKISRDFFKVNARSVLSASILVLLTVVINQINTTMGKIVLGFMIGPIPVAIYQISLSFQNYLMSFSNIIPNTYIPTISEKVANKDYEGLNVLFLNTSYVQIVLLTFIIGGFLSVGNEFIFIWLGRDRAIAYILISALMLSSIIHGAQYFLILHDFTENKHLFRNLAYFFSITLNVIVSVALILLFPNLDPLFSVLIGTASSFILFDILINIYFIKNTKYNLKEFFLNLCKYVLISLFSAIVVNLLLSNLKLNVWAIFFIKGFAFVAIYGLLSFIIEHKKIILFFKKQPIY